MNNPELQRAWQIIENTGTHLFLTGKAADHQKFFFAKCPGVGINRL